MFALRERRMHVTQEDFEMAASKVLKKVRACVCARVCLYFFFVCVCVCLCVCVCACACVSLACPRTRNPGHG